MEALRNLVGLLNRPIIAISISAVRAELLKLIDAGNLAGVSVTLSEMTPLFAALRSDLDIQIQLLIIKLLQCLLKCPENRLLLLKDKFGIETIVSCIVQRSTLPTTSSTNHSYTNDILRLVVILSYDDFLIKGLVATGIIPPIIRLLSLADVELRICLLSALQALCCAKEGRKQLFAHGNSIFDNICSSCASDISAMRARAVGLVHNISVDPLFIARLREANLISLLVPLLQDPSVEICQAVVGTIQNMSREYASRMTILALPFTVGNLIDLIAGGDVVCQVGAVGALLNLVGPTLSEIELKELSIILTDAVAMGVIKSSMFDIS